MIRELKVFQYICDRCGKTARTEGPSLLNPQWPEGWTRGDIPKEGGPTVLMFVHLCRQCSATQAADDLARLSQEMGLYE